MSKDQTAVSQKTADQTAEFASKEPGIISRAFSSATRLEQSFADQHPIVAGAVSVGVAAGTAAIARPVARKATALGKRAFGGLARKASEEVAKETAAEGARAFTGAAGSLKKLFRRGR